MSNCEDDAEWCKDVIQSNCDTIVKEGEGVEVKYYCKKTCNQCDGIFFRKHPNTEISRRFFNGSELNKNERMILNLY